MARERLAHRWRAARIIAIEGPDRLAFLQGQLTQDVSTLRPGEARPTAALTARGKLLFAGWVVADRDRVLLALPGGTPAGVAEHLAKYAVFQKIPVSDVSDAFARVSLYGPLATRVEVPDGVLRLPPHAEFSGELLVPRDARDPVERALAAAGSAALPEPEAEALRIEAGRPAFGRDIGPENLPDEAGLADAISATKGCYVGQEIVARRRTYGRMNRRLVGYRFPDGLVAPDAVLSRPDVPPERDRTEAGRVTSAAVSSRFGPIGLGFAFHDVPLGARLVTREAPRRAAVVSPLPFA